MVSREFNVYLLYPLLLELSATSYGFHEQLSRRHLGFHHEIQLTL